MPTPDLGADRLSGSDGLATIDTGGSPIVLDIDDFTYEEKGMWIEFQTAGGFGQGRRYRGQDWYWEATARVAEAGTTPLFFRRGAAIVFDLRTDDASTPALKIVGTGNLDTARLRSKVGEMQEYYIRVHCTSQSASDLPTITPA